tara:strand:- start:2141 stop:4102 length:1962 start_codon:yes stop_codon:yes gene_type:complete
MVKSFENSGFTDPTGQYPKESYWLKSSVNRADYGDVSFDLTFGGADVGMNFDLAYQTPPLYPNNNTKETASGHVIQYDDTFGRERVLIRHRTGSGIELRPDGTVLLSSTNKHILTVASDQSIIVEGDARMIYNGNVDVEVIGDYNLNVGGNSTTKVAGNVIEKITGRRDASIESTQTTEVKENYELSILGNNTTTTLGDGIYLTKGSSKQHVGGKSEYFVKDRLDITSEEGTNISAPNINVGADDVSIFGTTGTIGGDNIIMYTKNLYAQKTVYSETIDATKTITAKTIDASKTIYAETMSATTFHGNLQGTAAAQGSITATAVTADDGVTDSDETALPTAAIMTAYLDNSDKGIKRVSIDGDDGLKNKINLAVETDQVITYPLTTGEVRARLRNSNNLSKSGFINRQIADKVLSEDYALTVPPGLGRIVSSKPSTVRGKNVISTQNAAYGKFLPRQPKNDFVPDPQYIITDDNVILPSTKLSDKISLSKFLSGRGNKVTLNHITINADKIIAARNLQQQTMAIEAFNNNLQFINYRLVVIEALYKPGPGETLDDLSTLSKNGQSTAYQVINDKGLVDLPKTFELAEYWKNSLRFEKLILDYDSYNVDKSLSAQVMVVMPNITETYEPEYRNQIETRYNNNIQSKSDLVEIKL